MDCKAQVDQLLKSGADAYDRFTVEEAVLFYGEVCEVRRAKNQARVESLARGFEDGQLPGHWKLWSIVQRASKGEGLIRWKIKF